MLSTTRKARRYFTVSYVCLLADLKSYKYTNSKLHWHISLPIGVSKQDCPLSHFSCAESLKALKMLRKWFIYIENHNLHTINLTGKGQGEWGACGWQIWGSISFFTANEVINKESEEKEKKGRLKQQRN